MGRGGEIGHDGAVEDVEIVLGAVASCPVDAVDARSALLGAADGRPHCRRSGARRPTGAADGQHRFWTVWRKRMVKAFVGYALRELRGDDMRADRLKIARQLLEKRRLDTLG